MAFVEEVESLSGGRVRIVPQNEMGHIDLSLLQRREGRPAAVYCCGPNPLIDAVERACSTATDLSLHRERFSADPAPPLRRDGGFEVELARTGTRLTVGPYEKLLDVLEEAGCSVDSSCRAGICGACIVKVLAGRPDHRDDILTKAERDANNVMLTCVSRARDGLLVLDL
jgi:ferredoxin